MAMRVLNFNQAKNTIMLSLMGSKYRVPMLMGDRGCGKTSMMQDIAKEMDANLICIDANVLKEGEIGGIPSIYSNNNFAIQMSNALIAGITRLVNTNEKNEDSSPDIRFNTVVEGIKKFAVELKNSSNNDEEMSNNLVYATHVKLQQCMNFFKKNPNKKTILFIDEFNRCDSIVKREIMNLVLNREINGFELPSNVYVICACNPSSNFEPYRDTDYQVEEMDEAQLDRFRWIAMKSDLTQWINWGQSINEETGDTYIDQQVIEYLMDREEFLNNVTTSKEDIKTSPRSWEFVSDAYRSYIALKESKKPSIRISENDFLNTIAGDVGLSIASDFMAFLEDNKNPLIRPEQIFDGVSYKKKKLDGDVAAKISRETVLRKNVLIHNCLRYIRGMFVEERDHLSEEFKIKEKIFIEIITSAIKNNDLMYSLLLDLRLSKTADDKDYLKHIQGLKNVEILNAFTKLNQSF